MSQILATVFFLKTYLMNRMFRYPMAARCWSNVWREARYALMFVKAMSDEKRPPNVAENRRCSSRRLRCVALLAIVMMEQHVLDEDHHHRPFFTQMWTMTLHSFAHLEKI